MSSVEIKDFNTLIDHKPFFDEPVKKKKKRVKNLMKCQENELGEVDGATIFSFLKSSKKTFLIFL